MAEQKIQLPDIEDGSTEESHFYESDTILDLRKRLSKDQNVVLKDVTLYQAFLKLEDEIMVKDVADTVEGISFGFTDCLEVHLDSDDDDGIWVIKNGKWSILVRNREGNFFD